MKSLWWPITQDDWYGDKKRRLGHSHAQREDHVNTLENGYPQVKERDHRKKKKKKKKKTTLKTPDL